MSSAGSTAPAAAPSAATDQKSIEIIQATQSRRELYPDLNSPEDLDGYKYSDLMKPLKAKLSSMQEHHKSFFQGLSKLEKKIAKLALGGFSYTKAKAVARPSEMPLFTGLDTEVNRITAATFTSGGTTMPPAPPQYDSLFSALTMTQFNAKMNNTLLVSPQFATDGNFRDSAGALMRHILKYRNDNKQTLQDETVYQYLDKIFAAKEDQIETEIDNSTIIDKNLISPGDRESIEKGWNEYILFRERMEKGLRVEKVVKAQKASVLSKPFEAARGGMRFVAKKIEGFRANWAGMDGKERFLAGSSIVIGLAWFLNTDNEHADKFRSILGKAGLIAIGALGANAVAKVVTGQSGEALISNLIKDKSGKLDVLKDGFSLDANGARIMNNSIGILGNYDFSELGSLYLEQQAKYKAYNIKDELKELPVGGVAANEMSSNEMFLAMRYLDAQLQRQGSSIEKIVKVLEEMKAEAEADGKPFTMPTYAMIITSVLMKNKKIVFNKDGTPSLASKNKEITFTSVDRDYTRKWWMLTGAPSDWRSQIAGAYPQESPNIENLQGISTDIISKGTALSSYITTDKFGRYTKGFMDLYNNKIKSNPGDRVNYITTPKGYGFMTSRVPVNPNLASKDKAQVAAIKSAYENALRSFEKYLQKSNPTLLAKIKPRLHEFIQPVGGVMTAPTYKVINKQVIDRSKPQQYVMFCRYVLPNTREFALRLNREWPDGDMLNQRKVNILKSGDILTRGTFHTLARDLKFKKLKKVKNAFYVPVFDGFDSKFAGVYESFLANWGLRKNETDKIDKVLSYWSREFAGSGVTEQGLVRYLATHKPSPKELVNALGAAPAAHFSWITGAVRSATNSDLAKVSFATARLLASFTDNQKVELKKDIFAKFGTVMILACYGDINALLAIAEVDTKLYKSILKTFNFAPGGHPNPNTTEDNFEKGVLPHYLAGVFRMHMNSSKRKKGMTEVGKYLAASH